MNLSASDILIHFVVHPKSAETFGLPCSCTCLTFFKCGACEHAILATMMLDKRNVQIPSKYRIDRPSAVPSKKIGLENFEYAGNSSSSEQDDDFEVHAPPPPPTKKSLDFSCMEDTPGGGRKKRKVKPDDYVYDPLLICCFSGWENRIRNKNQFVSTGAKTGQCEPPPPSPSPSLTLVPSTSTLQAGD